MDCGDVNTALTSVSPTGSTTAWAVAGSGNQPMNNPLTLVRSTNGGRTWTPVPAPCRRAATNMEPYGVDFVSATAGWLMCTNGLAQGGPQPDALFATSDGGQTWQLEAADCVGLAPQNSAPTALPCGFNYPATAFLADGRGWIWMTKGNLSSTTEGDEPGPPRSPSA